MEANKFEIMTTTDKERRDRLFQEYRNSTEANERQVVKFSGVEEVFVDGKSQGFVSNYSIAYPFKVTPQNHGSKRNPRVYPGRKKAA